MDKPTIDVLMQDLLAVVNGPEREEGEYTPEELAKVQGVTTDVMAKRLLSAHRAGKVTRRKLFVDGRMRYVYRLAK